MKILFWTDPHFTSMRLGCRKDDYPEAIFAKTVKVMELAMAEKVDLILCGGDLYHTKRIAKAYENRLIELFKSVPIRQCCVVGNHDVYYANAATVDRGPLGTMFAAGIFDPQPPECVIETDDVMIIMVPYALTMSAFNVDTKKTVVLAAHTFLETGYDDCELPPEMTLQADYILLGHDHVPYEIERRERALIVRPGSLSRGTRHEENWHRSVMVAIIDTDAMTARYEAIPCASAAEIFSRERIESERTLQKAKILDDLTTTISMSENVPEILASMQMTPEVRARVTHWLTEFAII